LNKGIAMSEVNKKEKWGKPKLIILTRGKPEEGILTVCKGPPETGPGGYVGNCGSSVIPM